MKKKIIYVDFTEKRRITFFRFKLNKLKDFIFHKNKVNSKPKNHHIIKDIKSNNTLTKIY